MVLGVSVEETLIGVEHRFRRKVDGRMLSSVSLGYVKHSPL